MSVNKTVLIEWINTLETTEARQISGVLADGDGRCCLGLLSDLAVKHGVIQGYMPEADLPSTKVVDWVGMKTFPHLTPEEHGISPTAITRYSAMNDQGRTFPQIAAALRELLS